MVEESFPISRRTRSREPTVAVKSMIDTKKQRAQPTCSRCGDIGHRSTNKACPGRGLQILSDLAASAAANAADREIANAIAIRIANALAAPHAASPSLLASSLKFDDPRAIHPSEVC
jgi:hypothetical protein